MNKWSRKDIRTTLGTKEENRLTEKLEKMREKFEEKTTALEEGSLKRNSSYSLNSAKTKKAEEKISSNLLFPTTTSREERSLGNSNKELATRH